MMEGNCDLHYALEKLLLVGRRCAPYVLQNLMGVEELSPVKEFDTAQEFAAIHRLHHSIKKKTSRRNARS